MLKFLDDKFEEIILIVILFLMTLVLGVQIVARYIFNNSLSWSEEFVRYMLIWSAFMSIPYSIKKGLSIRVDFFLNRMTYKCSDFIKKLSLYFMVFLFGILSLFTLEIVKNSLLSGQRSSAMGMPIIYLHLLIFLSIILSLFRTFQKIWELRK
ncbi:TRAP transporter small permease [Peptoniphilus raoultii]|uniref:TRAP transporter small permease n=1 Tax=Peptoniphilus raoultii TaxID=1776387 RepID=UPI0008D9D020|nr:TRAP transporter small permease [Peptoniphilus raoultii]